MTEIHALRQIRYEEWLQEQDQQEQDSKSDKSEDFRDRLERNQQAREELHKRLIDEADFDAETIEFLEEQRAETAALAIKRKREERKKRRNAALAQQ